MEQNNISNRYRQEELNYEQYCEGGINYEFGKTWLSCGTVDAWRHNRMYQSIDPLIKAFPDSKWVTIGDGRYGNDAHYIKEKGIDVLATDISDKLLISAMHIGYIDKYKKENVEELSFTDNEFDFVFCKEAFHHFPRPMLALYEMCRVAKRGIVLIEPNDVKIIYKDDLITFKDTMDLVRSNCIEIRKWLSARVFGKPREITYANADFEDIGNYVYTISKRELEKFSLSMNFSVLAFKGINDAYYKGVESEIADGTSKLFKKVKNDIHKQNIMGCKGLLIAFLLKEDASSSLVQDLIKMEFQVIYLPKNPKSSEVDII